jgi:hypothetical protein
MFFPSRSAAQKCLDFFTGVVPLRSKLSKRLVSQDYQSNLVNYKYTIMAEVRYHFIFCFFVFFHFFFLTKFCLIFCLYCVLFTIHCFLNPDCPRVSRRFDLLAQEDCASTGWHLALASVHARHLATDLGGPSDVCQAGDPLAQLLQGTICIDAHFQGPS